MLLFSFISSLKASFCLYDIQSTSYKQGVFNRSTQHFLQLSASYFTGTNVVKHLEEMVSYGLTYRPLTIVANKLIFSNLCLGHFYVVCMSEDNGGQVQLNTTLIRFACWREVCCGDCLTDF